MGAVIVNELEATRQYDIVRRDGEKALFWLEGAADLSLAKSRVEQLLTFWPGEYQIFDLRTKEVVLTASAQSSPCRSVTPRSK
jgi:hypothetical protein